MRLDKWFKHYNNAHQGQTIATLWAENDTECIAFYWTLLEIVSQWESDERRGEVELNLAIFKSKLGMNSQRSRKLLVKIAETFKINLEWNSDKSFKLFIPNWLELQENRGGKRVSKKDQKNSKNGQKKEERRKNIDIDTDIGNNTKVLFLPGSVKVRSRGNNNAPLDFESMTFSDKAKENFTEFGFTQKQINSLVDAFVDQRWIESELFKSLAWIESNPQRRPKKFPKFFNNWLQRGWESYRKTLPTNKTSFVAKQKTAEELRAIYGEDVDL